MKAITPEKLTLLRTGCVIPAVPLALDDNRKFDEATQRRLMNYYVDAGAGGVAVGMHFTQFEIRNPGIDLFKPVLATCADAVDKRAAQLGKPLLKIAGISGPTESAVKQAQIAAELGYDFAIPSLACFRNALDEDLLYHMRKIGEVMPLFGFYLLTGVGGIQLSHRFWRGVMDLPNIYGIKIAPFNRYFTLDVTRALAESGRMDDITLYTGNDDSIVHDLITPFRYTVGGEVRTVRIKGGLLGQWGCWTSKAVELLAKCHAISEGKEALTPDVLNLAAEITDANAALFDPINGFAGSIPGVNEVLRRQGLMKNALTLKPNEVLSPGQSAEIDRVLAAYPHLQDDAFVAANLNRW
jgi:dihydrodipicolinate synthase/N-acetylneuraminate lyase